MRFMKKMVSILLAAAVVFQAAGCSSLFPKMDGGGQEPGNGGSGNAGKAYAGTQVQLYDIGETEIRTDEEEGVCYVSNIVVICVTPEATEADRQELAKTAGGVIDGRNDPIGEIYVRVSSRDLDGLTEICRRLEQDARVVYATFDAVTDGDASPFYPNDPKYMSWTRGDRDNRNWGLIAVDAPGAWGYRDQLETVTLGVVDNGFLATHDDLENVLQRVSGSTQNEADHGTHVAGIIGAQQGNSTGISGIAPNARLRVYGGALNPNGSFVTSGLYAGLAATVQAGARAVNFSIGSSGALTRDTQVKTEETINAEGQRASHAIGALLAAGHDFVVVQSAGNGAANHLGVDAVNNGTFCAINRDNCDTSQASADDIIGRVIVVGNAMRSGNGYMMNRSSNGGARVDVSAPGTNIFSCVTGTNNRNNDGYSNADGLYDASQTDDGDTDGRFYTYLSGTSMAAPFVTGLAGLVWGANPGLTGREVKQIICSSSNSSAAVADNPDSTHTSGSTGLINAKLCVEDALSRAGKQPVAGGYADVVREYEQIYGTFEIHDATAHNANGQYYTGVFLVKLIDFDRDGSDELVVGYAEENIEFYISWPHLDVWTMENGKPVPAYRDAMVTHSDVGTHCEYTQYNGTWYLVDGYGGSGYDLDYMVLEGVEFHTEVNLYCSDDDYVWKINDREVSDDEGSGLYQAMEENAVRYHGMFSEYYGETQERLTRELEEGKRAIGY